MFDDTVTTPLGPIVLTRAGTRRVGFALEEAVKGKEAKYGGTYRPTYKLLPPAFCTCGDYSITVKELLKDLGKIKAEMDDDYVAASDQAKLGIRARETGRLRRRLSIVTQKSLAYGTLRYIGHQNIAERARSIAGPPTQQGLPGQLDGLCPALIKRARRE